MTGYQQNKRKQVKMTNLPLVILRVAIPAMLVLVIPSLRLSAYYQNCGPIVWNVGSPIQANIVAPVSGQGVCPDTLVLCHASASDVDHWGNACSSGNQDDIVNSHTWSATGGSFPNGNMGSLVYWKAPCTPGNVTITCSFDDLGNAPLPPGSGTRDDLSVERTVTVTVLEPIQELSFLSPSGTIGGGVPIRLQVRTRCSSCELTDLRHKEDSPCFPWCNYCDSDWCYVFDGCTGYGGVTSETVGGITTTEMEYGWDTAVDFCRALSMHNGLRNLRAKMRFTDTCGQITDAEARTQVTLKNVTITSVTPKIIIWTGEPGLVPINVTVDDNDLASAMDIWLWIYDTVDRNHIKTLKLEGVTGSTHTFHWDGTGGPANWLQGPGTYTYDVGVTQEQDCDNGVNYRSQYLEIERATENGAPIYEAEFYDYDDGGTPEDDSDDNIIYIIRHYVLKDSLGRNASSGELLLYDPDLEQIACWNVADLQCLIHDSADGLVASEEGVGHELLVPVQASLIQHDRPYRFVLQMKDSHSDCYRDHQNRFAFDLNARYAKATIVLDGSANFLPEVGNSTSLTIKVVDEAGRVLPKARVPITITATPSHLRGVCTNYNLEDPELYSNGQTQLPKADFTWAAEPDRTQYNPSVSKTIYSETDPGRPQNELEYLGGTYAVNLSSYDYGGRIKIEASPPNDGNWDHVSVKVARDTQNRTYMWVPEDFDEDRLADAWERQYPTIFSLTRDDFAWDEDSIPNTPGSNTGDGYRAFEEYRGIRSSGTWRRLDPNKKELLVSTTLGTGYFATATGVTVYEVDSQSDQEMAHSNYTTLNSPSSKTDDYGSLHNQKGMRIKDVGVFQDEPDVVGRARQGTPNVSDWENCVRIATTTIHKWAVQNQADEAQVLKRVITHEMGHDVTLARTGNYHHPDGFGCLMEQHVLVGNYTLSTFCTDCKEAVQLH